MKKFLSVILTFIIIFTCCACSSSSTEQTNNGNNEKSTTYTMNSEEEALAKLLTICFRTFKDPLSTKIKNVWFYKSTLHCCFTVELESKNGYGNMVSGYYGGMILDTSITNKLLNEIDNKIDLTPELYFKKDDIFALQHGNQLSSQCVSAMQNYFIKNYHD